MVIGTISRETFACQDISRRDAGLYFPVREMLSLLMTYAMDPSFLLDLPKEKGHELHGVTVHSVSRAPKPLQRIRTLCWIHIKSLAIQKTRPHLP